MFIKQSIITLLCITLGGFILTASAKDLVGTYSGDRSGNTAKFEVQAPWIMEWTVNGDQGQYETVEFSLINAISDTYEGVALKTKSDGSGVRLFEQSGQFYFRVDASMMNWSIKVTQLSAQEAEQYKPASYK